MSLKTAELNEIMKVGAIAVLFWSFISLFRSFPLDLNIIIPIATITLVYWVVEIGLIFLFDHYLVPLAAIVIYALFSTLFLFTGGTIYLYVGYVSFGMVLPKITRLKGGLQENRRGAGFQAAGFALGFSLSILGFSSGMMISSLNSFIVLLVGAFLGIYVIINRRQEVKRKVHSDKGIIRKGFVYFFGSLAIGMAMFMGIAVYLNSAVLSYFTGLDYEYILICVMVSFAIAGIVCVFFEKLTARFENRILLLFILLNGLGLLGFALLLFVQTSILMILLILANISLYLGISVAFHLLSKLNPNWSFIPFFTFAFGLYALVMISGISYFYLIGLAVQLATIVLLKWIVPGEEAND